MSGSRNLIALTENAEATIRDLLTLFEQDDGSVMFRGLEALWPQISVLGNETVPIFVAGLEGPKARSRVVCAWMLCLLDKACPGSLDPDQQRCASAVFVHALSAEPRDVQLLAVSVLAITGLAPQAATRRIQELLFDIDPHFRVGAAAILANLASDICGSVDSGVGPLVSIADILVVLKKELMDGDAFTRMIAATALSQTGIGKSWAVDALAQIAEHAEPSMQLGMVQALGRAKFVTKTAIRVLSKIRDDEAANPVIREAATSSLIEISGNETEFLQVFLQATEEADFPVFQGCVEAAIRSGRASSEIGRACAELLGVGSVELRRLAAFWLSQSTKMALSATSELLDRLWNESDAIAFEFVLLALGRCGTTVIAPLIEVIREENVRKAPYAQIALIHIGGSCVAAVIRELLRDDNKRVQMTGLWILIGIGPRSAIAGEAVLDLMKNADDETKPLLLRALAIIATKEDAAIQSLADAYLSPDAEISHWAMLGLVRIGKESIPFIERMKAHADAPSLIRIEELLHRLGSSAPPSRLERYGNDSSLLLFAWIGYLVETNGRVSFRRLQNIFAKKDPTIKCAEYSGRPSATGIGLTIEELEKDLCDGRRIIERATGSRKSGSLTVDGKRLLREVQAYLTEKRLWASRILDGGK